MAEIAHRPGRVVAAYYDRLAAVYGEGELFRARRAAALGAIADELRTAGSILDLGCGNGAYAAEMVVRHRDAYLVGTDLSPAMLAAARRRLGERFPLVRGDAMRLPFPAGTFDLVFMSHVLLLVPDVEGCAAEVARCLRPGGSLVATVGAGGWRSGMQALLGADGVRELERLIAPAMERAAGDDTGRAAAAATRAGLHAAWRTAPYAVSWPALEEWLRIRWLSIADAETQVQAEGWLTPARARAAGRTLALEETLLVAGKSA